MHVISVWGGIDRGGGGEEHRRREDREDPPRRSPESAPNASRRAPRPDPNPGDVRPVPASAGWCEIRSGSLRRDDDLRLRAFQHEDAEIVLWIAPSGGRIVRFHVAWTAPRRPQRIVEWTAEAGGRIRTGIVDEDDRTFSMHKGAPVVRHDSRPEAAAVDEAGRILDQAPGLPPEIAAAVREALAAAPR